MKTSNRDLLVLLKNEYDSEQAMESALQALNQLLANAETIDKLCVVNEVADLNKYKIYTLSKKLRPLLQQESLKPFQFIINKN